MSKKIRFCILLIFGLNAATTFAFDRKVCMTSITSNPSYLEEVTKLDQKLSSQLLTLLSAGVDSDFMSISQISSTLLLLQSTANSINVIIALRLSGSFKQQIAVDKLVDMQLTNYYQQLQLAIKNLTRQQNLLKNSALKNDASELIIELSRISERLKLCERV
jgi:ABC-type glutathione transport system ATPase component